METPVNGTIYLAAASPHLIVWDRDALPTDYRLPSLSLDSAVELVMDTKSTDYMVEVSERANDSDDTALPVLKAALPGVPAPNMAKSV